MLLVAAGLAPVRSDCIATRAMPVGAGSDKPDARGAGSFNARTNVRAQTRGAADGFAARSEDLQTRRAAKAGSRGTSTLERGFRVAPAALEVRLGDPNAGKVTANWSLGLRARMTPNAASQPRHPSGRVIVAIVTVSVKSHLTFISGRPRRAKALM